MNHSTSFREILLAGFLIIAIGCANKPTTTTESSNRDYAPLSESDQAALVITPNETTREFRAEAASRRTTSNATIRDYNRNYDTSDRLPASVNDTESTTTLNERSILTPTPSEDITASHSNTYIWLLLIALAVLIAFAGVRKMRGRNRA